MLRLGLVAAGVRLANAAGLPQQEDEAHQPPAMRWPRDHGSHPDFGTEWWYVTGYARGGDRLFGFQITFFRSRVAATQRMTSRFAARQLLFAHAAVTDVQAKRLLHDQRIARAGFGVAEAATDDAAIRLRDWSLAREAGADGAWRTSIAAEEFALELAFRPTQPVLLQGMNGISRKGPLADNVSHYYSLPQLATTGQLRIGRQRFELPPLPSTNERLRYPLAAAAWLDREWSNALLHPDALGWDWIGMNLDDGAALMAFQIRHRNGGVLWDGGSFRSAEGELRVFKRGETLWRAQRRWSSAASGATYPVEWALETPAGSFTVAALLEDQELDSRGSTGAIYWEGLSDLLGAGGRRSGRGYLEMTGYASALRLSAAPEDESGYPCGYARIAGRYT